MPRSENVVERAEGAGERVQQPPAPRRSAGLHGIATAGMALCAVVAIVSFSAWLTIGWPGRSGRVVIAIMVCGTIGFLSCASAAVLSAARNTYARPEKRDR